MQAENVPRGDPRGRLATTDPVTTTEADQPVQGQPAIGSEYGDNGAESACTANAGWPGQRTGRAVIPAGQPWRNGYIKSFNGRRRDECRNINLSGP
jgi:hypothetical protein